MRLIFVIRRALWSALTLFQEICKAHFVFRTTIFRNRSCPRYFSTTEFAEHTEGPTIPSVVNFVWLQLCCLVLLVYFVVEILGFGPAALVALSWLCPACMSPSGSLGDFCYMELRSITSSQSRRRRRSSAAARPFRPTLRRNAMRYRTAASSPAERTAASHKLTWQAGDAHGHRIGVRDRGDRFDGL